MGKIRDRFSNDTEGLAQWVGRKLRNHNPMSERDKGMVEGHRKKVAHGMKTGILADDPTKVVYQMGNGRRFVLSVQEIPEGEELPMVTEVGS